MSWKATAFVKGIRNGITQTEKLVLLLIADYHNTAVEASWPSVSLLAEDCLMSERNLYRILDSLDAKKFIIRCPGSGRGRLSKYQIVGLDVTEKGDKLSSFRARKGDMKDDKKGDISEPLIRKEPVIELYEPVKGMTEEEIRWAIEWNAKEKVRRRTHDNSTNNATGEANSQ